MSVLETPFDIHVSSVYQTHTCMQAPLPTLCISAKKTHNKGSRTRPIMSTLMPRSGIPVIFSRATLSCDSSYYPGFILGPDIRWAFTGPLVLWFSHQESHLYIVKLWVYREGYTLIFLHLLYNKHCEFPQSMFSAKNIINDNLKIVSFFTAVRKVTVYRIDMFPNHANRKPELIHTGERPNNFESCGKTSSDALSEKEYIIRDHYANTYMQYTAIFHGCKNVKFQMKKYNFFLIFAQNIDCGYPQSMF